MIKLSNRDRKQMAEMLAGEIARYERLGMSGVDKGTSCHELDQWFRMSAYRLALAALTAEQAAQTESDDYCNLKELYHAQEKRLFKLAQRIKGPAFDKYAHNTAQAIDVLEASLIDNIAQPYEAPAGWRMVPVEPTAEMYDAGDKQLATKQVWDAMLAAAPNPAGRGAKRRAFIDSLADDTAPPVDDLVMLVRRLVHALKKSNPDSPLISQVSDYMQRSGYWQGKDCLRSVADDDTDDKRCAFIDSLQDDTAPQQYESLSTEAALKIGMERYGAAMKKLADNGDK